MSTWHLTRIVEQATIVTRHLSLGLVLIEWHISQNSNDNTMLYPRNINIVVKTKLSIFIYNASSTTSLNNACWLNTKKYPFTYVYKTNYNEKFKCHKIFADKTCKRNMNETKFQNSNLATWKYVDINWCPENSWKHGSEYHVKHFNIFDSFL